MVRREDWPLRLNAWLDSARERAFKWGAHDCVMAAADAVRMMTGEDPAKAYRGLYTSKREAVVLLADHGGLEAMVSSVLGAPLPTPKLAQRGDLVLVDSPEGQALSVVVGAAAVGPGKAGVVFTSMGSWLVAWRV